MKKIVLIEAPFLTKSGYGYRSRDLIRAILYLYKEKFNIVLSNLTWGTTPIQLPDAYPDLKPHLLKVKLNQLPDIHIMVTIPSDYRPIGKYNILFTAGIETNLVSSKWLQKLNEINPHTNSKCDLVITSSKFGKNVFKNSKYSSVDNTSGNVVGELKLNTDVDVLFEGYDENTYYNKLDGYDNTLNTTLNNISTNFNFLCVGNWLNGDIGEDRKNIGLLLKTFLIEFKNNSNVGLVLKTQGASISEIDKDRILNNIEIVKELAKLELSETDILPSIHLLYGDLTDAEMNDLYNHPKVNTMVSFTSGEGYGRPLLEFSVTGKPILASNWSGHLDFLNPTGCSLLDGKLEQVHKSVVWKDIIIPESSWFKVNPISASKKMRENYEFYKNHKEKAKVQMKFAKSFTYDKMTKKLEILFNRYIPKEMFVEYKPIRL